MGLVFSALQSQQQVEDDDDVTKRRLPNDYAAYRPISNKPGEEQIRLLHLVPTDNDQDEITGVLVDAPPDWKKLPYIALSYCWGSLSDSRRINMIHFDRESKDMHTEKGSDENGVHEYVVASTKHQVPFNVTQNLYGALKALRRASKKTEAFLQRDNYAYWIDAICINQADMAERSSQVGTMGRIYSDATVVFVWLGESPDTMRGLSLVHTMQNYASKTWNADFDYLNPTEEQITALTRLNFSLNGERLGPESCFHILDRLFSNPYFKRMWVLQEATIKAERTYIFSPKWLIPMGWIILADRFRHTWRRLYPASNLGHLPVIWAQMLQQRLVGARADPEGVDKKRMLMNLPQLFFSTYAEFDSTDLRDKLYALLDLCYETRKGSMIRKELAPDYTRSTSELFRAFTIWCIRLDGGGLDTLSKLGVGPRRFLPDEIAKLDHDNLPGLYIDATAHPSWALWPTSGGYWSHTSLGRVGQGKSRFTLGRNKEPILLDLRSHPSIKVPEDLRSRFLPAGGRRIGTVKSIHRMPIRRFDTQQPTIINNRWLTEELAEDMKKYASTSILSLAHPYRANEFFKGGLGTLWDCLRRKEVGVPEAQADGTIMWGSKTLSPEVIELLEQEWLGREGGRYEGNEDLMFRDFLETLLLSPVYRQDESPDGSSGVNNEGLPKAPWDDDPDIATSFAMFWVEHDPQFSLLPPRIAKFLRGAPLDQAQKGLSRQKMFPFLFEALGKCFFITEDERMGLCPPETRQGDIVVALFGASVPFVLRPVGNETDFEGTGWDFEGHVKFKEMLYRFIGDCYVHGRMTSAYLDEQMAQGGSDEVFTLC